MNPDYVLTIKIKIEESKNFGIPRAFRRSESS